MGKAYSSNLSRAQFELIEPVITSGMLQCVSELGQGPNFRLNYRLNKSDPWSWQLLQCPQFYEAYSLRILRATSIKRIASG